jgi:hypothetical protein
VHRPLKNLCIATSATSLVLHSNKFHLREFFLSEPPSFFLDVRNCEKQATANMGKRKRNNAQTNTMKKQTTTGIPGPLQDKTSLEPTNVNSLVSSEEIEVTVETLQSLTEHPALIKSKACKDLRTAIFDFRQACTTGMNSAGECHALRK